jgi:ribosomal protein L7Ae-like RNA K-turn-binding protein
MDKKQKALNLLGLATRARKLLSGESVVLEAVRKNEAIYVIVAENASENTKKQFLNKCEYYSVPIVIQFSKEEISQAIGKDRTVCAFIDNGFAASFQKLQ